jgi:heterotetrameric sarcosine oxidase gamma subunit
MSAADVCVVPAPAKAVPLESCFEFVAYPGRAAAAAALSAWPARAGQALRDGAGQPTVLYFAPDRWFIPAPAPTLLSQLAALERADCGTLIDVDGKWQELRIAPEQAQRMLARSIDVATVLADRDCAAIRLFDCPAILARHEAAFKVWIEASFAQSFLAVSRTTPDLPPSS